MKSEIWGPLKDFQDPGLINRQLFPQSGKVLEFLLIPDPFDKIDRDPVTVDLYIKIKDIDLNRKIPDVDRRTVTDIAHAFVNLTVMIHFAGINTDG